MCFLLYWLWGLCWVGIWLTLCYCCLPVCLPKLWFLVFWLLGSFVGSLLLNLLSEDRDDSMGCRLCYWGLLKRFSQHQSISSVWRWMMSFTLWILLHFIWLLWIMKMWCPWSHGALFPVKWSKNSKQARRESVLTLPALPSSVFLVSALWAGI